MKILPISKVREADEYTIKNEPVKSIDLMERAASACVIWIESKYQYACFDFAQQPSQTCQDSV